MRNKKELIVITKDDLDQKRKPELLTLTKNIRVKEHGEDTAKGFKSGSRVTVSGDDKIYLLQTGMAIRSAKQSELESDSNTDKKVSVQSEVKKKKIFG